MNRSELVSQTSRQVSSLSRDEVELIIDKAISNIEKALQEGDNVLLTRFGTFQIVDKAATRRRNPRDGNIIEIPAKKTVAFRASPILKAKI